MVKKCIITFLLLVVFMNCCVSAYEIDYNIELEQDFKFNQSTYNLRGCNDTIDFSMTLPYGYTMSDVLFKSEDTDVAIAFYDTFGDREVCFIESRGAGETRIKATISGTDYVTYCTIKVDDAIKLSVERKEGQVGATLIIDSTNKSWFSKSTMQAVEILVKPLNSTANENDLEWIRLGENMDGIALNQIYTYDIKENCEVIVKQVSWWTGLAYNGKLYELTRNSCVIDNLEPIFSIGDKVYIYEENNKSELEVGDEIQLNVLLLEIPIEDCTVIWNSYDDVVAYVDSNGMVTANYEGSTRIEAKVITNTGNTYTAIYPITVKRKPYNSKLKNYIMLFNNYFTI